MAEVAVIGGGVGGMAAALRLRTAGHDVVLLERLGRLGGKLETRWVEGFSFDTGPSLLTLPRLFNDLLGCAGRRLADAVDLVRLDPVCRYRFGDGSGFDVRASVEETAAEVERLRPGNAAEWRAWHAGARRIWEVAERTFLSEPRDGAGDVLRRLRSRRDLADLARVDPLRTLARRARAGFRDPRLRQWAGRYATYSGSSPYRAPATLACIAAVEADEGAWYVRGGLGGLATALAEALAGAGVEVRLGAEVEAVEVRDGRVAGVRLAGGEVVAAAAVVANVDAAHLYADILPHRRALRAVERAGRSSSAFVLLLGVEGRTPALAHHTVLFSADYREEFTAIHRRRVAPREPTVYICNPAAGDPGRAPEGSEALTVLVNVPGEGGVDWAAVAPGYRDHLLEHLAGRGLELRDRLRVCEVVHPGDLAERYRTRGGAIYGTSSNGWRGAFLRPGNRGAVPGLYLAGGSAHPGGGLPLVAMSGAIAARLADADLRGAAAPAGKPAGSPGAAVGGPGVRR